MKLFSLTINIIENDKLYIEKQKILLNIVSIQQHFLFSHIYKRCVLLKYCQKALQAHSPIDSVFMVIISAHTDVQFSFFEYTFIREYYIQTSLIQQLIHDHTYLKCIQCLQNPEKSIEYYIFILSYIMSFGLWPTQSCLGITLLLALCSEMITSGSLGAIYSFR